MIKEGDNPITPDAAIATVELKSSYISIKARGRFKDKDALDFIPTLESKHLLIDTPNYDGPLDLLLHLIKKHSMDIFDIPIVHITKKYLEALEQMRTLNLDIAGEFLVMAATLAQIKSKMLLPKDESNDEEEESNQEDPRAFLVKKLLRYKSFKEASARLLENYQIGRDYFFRGVNYEEDLDKENEHEEQELSSLEISELLDSLSKALKSADVKTVHTIKRERISLVSRIHDLMDFCQIRSEFSFLDAVKFFPIYEKIDVIITFLALLEMSRLKLLRINRLGEDDVRLSVVKENFYTAKKEMLDEELGKEESE